MDDKTFELFVDRFKRLEKQNDDILNLMRTHIKEDTRVHRVVDRHSVYFSFLYLGIPSTVAYVAKKLGFY